MNIAVTGATGFIGRYIVQQLLAAGHSCRCWRRASSNCQGFGPFADRIAWVDGQLSDQASMPTLLRGCNAVVHAALDHPNGQFRADSGDLVEFVQRNVVGSLQLIEAARALGVSRFVYISSCAVHDRILSDRPLDESHPTWSSNHYGAHKAAVEQFVGSYGFGQDYAICALRPTGVYGIRQPLDRSKWYSLVRAVVRGEAVDCRGGGKEVHAADVAKAVEILLAADNIAGQVFNCYDRYVSQLEVAQIARESAGSASQIRGAASAPKNRIVTDKLANLGMQFGGEPLLLETIQQMVAAIQAGAEE